MLCQEEQLLYWPLLVFNNVVSLAADAPTRAGRHRAVPILRVRAHQYAVAGRDIVPRRALVQEAVRIQERISLANGVLGQSRVATTRAYDQ